MSTANRVFVEISPHSLQLAVIAGRRLVACGDYAFDEKEALAAFIAAHDVKTVVLALVSPRQPFARLSGVEAVTVRSEEGLLACAQAMSTGLTAPLSAVACDATSGKAVDPAGQEPWLIAGTTAESLTAARDQLVALGLPAPVLTALALPAQLGTVVAALQDMPESARVAVLALGENDSVFGLVSAGGVGAVRSVAVGYTQIFNAVQVELGLKFRAAAPKLFFNPSYDFADAAERIAARLAVTLQVALAEFPDRPGILHVVGLPEKQEWLALAMGQALGMSAWTPDAAKICSQLEMEIAAEITPKANTLRLVQLAASSDATKAAWLPFSLGNQPKPAAAPMVAPAPAAVPIPAAVAPKKPVVAPPAAKPPVPLAKPVAPVLPRPAPKPVTAAAAPAKPPARKVPMASVVTVPPTKEPAPVQAEAASVHVASSPKRPWSIYGAVAAVVIIVAVVGGKFYADSHAQAKELALRQIAEKTRVETERVHRIAVEKAEATLKINPVTGLPAEWVSEDIGLTTFAGSAGFKQGAFRMTGFGRNIGNFKDSFLFDYVPLAGDGVVTVRLTAITDASRAAKVGLMMRGSLDDGASHVSLLIENGGKDIKVVWREKSGVQAAIINSLGDAVLSVPIWLRLVRAGSNITAYQSDNGKAWRIVAGTPLTVQMTGEIYAGMAVCSRDDVPALATFDHVSVPGWESLPPILAGSSDLEGN